MTKKEFFNTILKSEKARFSDETELKLCADLLTLLDSSEWLDVVLKVKLFSTKSNMAGFYGLKELSLILAEKIISKSQEQARQAQLKNYHGSDESALAILQEFFISQNLKNHPLWFQNFVREKLSYES